MMNDSEEKIFNNIDKNLDLLRTIYAISYIFGYRILGETFSIEFGSYAQKEFVMVFASVILVLSSIRFFWCVGNIRRYLRDTIRFGTTGVGKEQEIIVANLGKIREVMLVHVPMLLAHSFVFYLLCRVMGDLPNVGAFTSQVSEDLVRRFIGLYIFLLSLNSCWLYLLRTKGSKSSPEFFWMVNNFVTSALLLGLLIFWNSLKYNSLYTLDTQSLFIISLVLFLANCLIDYCFASKAYLIEQPG